MRRLGDICGRRCHDRESGQALVEFVLILLPLLIFVGGAVHIGIGVANWHDLNRIAYEGARFAATEDWPGCPAQTGTPTPCNGNPVCHPDPPDPTAHDGRSLLNYLRCEVIDAGLPASTLIEVCVDPAATAVTGDPITVKLQSRLDFLGSDESDPAQPHKASWFGVDLRGAATMRLETTPTKYTPTTC